ncbi:hypothetical protein CACET_c13860 [Clostridium aceticum]|uniref:Uncharacterized protein n=1 Tax=Clostridium aceticum TaxID=84022 RepID=A0A0G3W810_9CLOT|nr:hypothetical protein [Clostridium aceticum]AKL94851.1 hypothetical protein CACET_c13860 [Clostridium aceticum]
MKMKNVISLCVFISIIAILAGFTHSYADIPINIESSMQETKKILSGKPSLLEMI